MRIADVGSLRETCASWRQQIDSTAANSEEWRLLACAALGADAVPTTRADALSRTWSDACRILAAHPSRTSLLESSSTGLGTMSVRPSVVRSLLDWFVVAAEVAAVDCQVAFGKILNSEARSQSSLAIYTACSQKPPHNMQGVVYSWWLHHAFAIIGTIRRRLAHADDAVQQSARASFRSFVKHMTSVVLPYLDRFYVRRFEVAGDPAASLPTVREIGRRAMELMALPFDTPLPAAEPCPEVPLTAGVAWAGGDHRLVDDVALQTRQRRAWHQRDLERFDQILVQQVGAAAGAPLSWAEVESDVYASAWGPMVADAN